LLKCDNIILTLWFCKVNRFFDRRYNVEFNNKIKLYIPGVWHNDDEHITQLVYNKTMKK